ncbi:hypothetical protein EDD21DRAFT_106076 [Dissophora ornata]|nr:hypothetical protein EDD21DRAFT_106076 [Dissophora ornata]
MGQNPPLSDADVQLIEDKYEERWDDEAYDRAVEVFKVRVEDIGFEDPFELLSRYNVKSYESLREQLKRGPAMCFRAGWKSPLLGERIDLASVVSKCEHLSGPEFSGGDRVVVLDFWASWCDPCLEAGPELSDLEDEFSGRITVIGINNESIFSETKAPDRERLCEFLEENSDGFRYTIFLDNAEGHAKESKLLFYSLHAIKNERQNWIACVCV